MGDGPTPERLGRRRSPIVTWRVLCRKRDPQGGCPGQTCRISRNQPDPEEGEGRKAPQPAPQTPSGSPPGVSGSPVPSLAGHPGGSQGHRDPSSPSSGTSLPPGIVHHFVDYPSRDHLQSPLGQLHRWVSLWAIQTITSHTSSSPGHIASQPQGVSGSLHPFYR